MVVAKRWDEGHCSDKLDLICPLCHQKCAEEHTFDLLENRPSDDIDGEKKIVRKIVDEKCLVCGSPTKSYPHKLTPNVSGHHIHCLCGVCLSNPTSTKTHYFPSGRGCRILYLPISELKRKRTDLLQVHQTQTPDPAATLADITSLITLPSFRRCHLPNLYAPVIRPNNNNQDNDETLIHSSDEEISFKKIEKQTMKMVHQASQTDMLEHTKIAEKIGDAIFDAIIEDDWTLFIKFTNILEDSSVNDNNNVFTSNILITAIKHGQFKYIKRLRQMLQRHACAQEKEAYDKEALDFAVCNNILSAVKELIQDDQTITLDVKTFTSAINKSYVEMVHVILKSSIRIDIRQEVDWADYYAGYRGSISIIKSLLDYRINDRRPWCVENAQRGAYAGKQFKTLEWLLQHYPQTVETTKRILLKAIQQEDVKTLKLMTKYEVKIDADIMQAARAKSPEVLALIDKLKKTFSVFNSWMDD